MDLDEPSKSVSSCFYDLISILDVPNDVFPAKFIAICLECKEKLGSENFTSFPAYVVDQILDNEGNAGTKIIQLTKKIVYSAFITKEEFHLAISGFVITTLMVLRKLRCVAS